MKKTTWQPNYHIKRRANGKTIATAFTGVEAKSRADQLALETNLRHYVYLKRKRGGWRTYYRTPTAAEMARKEAAAPKRTWETVIAKIEADILLLQRYIAALRKELRLSKRKLKAHAGEPSGTDVPEGLAKIECQIGSGRFAVHSFTEVLTPSDLTADFAKRVLKK